MCKIKRRFLMIVTFWAAIAISSTAMAHKVNIFAYVEDGVVYTESYFPDGMADPGYYQPVPRGLEIRIAEKLAHLRELDKKHNQGKL